MAQTITNSTSTSNGITLTSGDVLNNTSTGIISVPGYAVYAGPSASGVSVSNAGSIIGGSASGGGVMLQDGGSVTNLGSAQISGFVGIDVSGAAGTVVNAGAITGDSTSGLGVKLVAGGSVTNQLGGSISGEVGVYASSLSATVINYGHIVGNDAIGPGIALNAGGSVTNHQGATISGDGGIISALNAATVVNQGVIESTASSSVGVRLTAGGTVVNSGTIIGTQDAVQFAAGYTNLLQFDPGGTFSGLVDGGNTLGASVVSTLQLMSGSATGTLSGLGSQYIDFGQVTVDSGAAWQLNGSNTLGTGGTLSNAGTVTLNSATLLTDGAVTGSGTLIIGDASTLDLEGTVAATQTVDFSGTSGVLQLVPADFSSTIDGVQAGDSIVLAGIANAVSASVVTGNTLQVSLSSGGPIDLQLDPTQDFSAIQFHVNTTNGNAVVSEIPCYLAGTLIRTDSGEVPVEQLRIGDLVTTHDGSAKPVRWIGRRSYAGAIAAGLRDVIPVAIAPGALADNLPVRELIVSPLHALYLDGVLVPAERLVNGRTIRRRPDIDPIQYFHVELDRHEVIFAEGAPAESFVDCDSRGMFHNARDYDALYPGEAGERWIFCAPRVESGETLAAIRRRLDARAGLSPETPDIDPGPLLGCLDGVEAGRISGWAIQPDRPEQAVWLEVLSGDGVIARVEARRYRADLEQAGIGDGRHGFELNLAGRFGQGGVIRVRRVSDGAELDGSPLLLRPFDRQGLEEEARRLVASAIADPGDAAALDGFNAELLRGVDAVRQLHAQRGASKRDGCPAGRRALIVDSALPRADRDAGSQAVLSHAAALRELGWQVEFVAPHALGDCAADAEALESVGHVVHRAPHVASVEEVLRRNRNGYDLVYLHRLATAEAYAALARLWQARARLIYSVADLHHLRVGRQAAVQASEECTAEAAALRVRELNAMRLVDAVITHSSTEAAYLAELAPNASVHVVPWVPCTRPSTVPFAARQGVACIGSWTHAPNVDAVRWLVAAIMPLVWQHAPRVELLVAGSGWPQAVPWITDHRIRLVGQVGSLDAVLSMVRLSVAPLRFGAGLKGKVLDSLAAAVPVVMTPIAAEGFALEAEAGELVADNAEALAGLILRAHGDAALNRAAAQAGRRLVEAQFTGEVVRAGLLDALGSTLSALGRRGQGEVGEAIHAAA